MMKVYLISRIVSPVSPQSLRMYILGEEAMVSNPQGSVAGGHVARSAGGHLPYSGHRHPGHHCGHTNLHGPKGTKQSVNPVSSQITGLN